MKIFQKKNRAGFTLVELMVVITIVGILASIVLIDLSNTRKKGEDAAVQLGLREVRNAAELYYSNNETYVGVCDTSDNTLSNSGDFGRIENYLNEHNGPTGIIGCRESDNAYAVISSLNLGNCWCVDSQGSSREVTLTEANCQDQLTSTACP